MNNQSSDRLVLSHLTIHRSGVILAVYLIVLEILFLIIGLLVRFPLSFFITSVESATTLYSVNTIIGLILILLRIILIMVIVFQWLNNYYEVRPGRVIYKSGLLSRREKEINLSGVSRIDLSQGFFGRIFNIGTINFYIPTTKEWVYMYNIPSPQRNISLLRKMLVKKE